MLTASLLALLAVPVQDAPGAFPRAVYQRYLELAGRVAWPEFDATSIPVALVEGERTTLFAHPDPPPGFEDLAGDGAGARVADGEPETAHGDGPALVGGVLTAVLHLGDDLTQLDSAAADLVGHAFRVYVGRELRDWNPAPGQEFLYPAEDAEVLASKRLEVAALRRALLTQDGEESAGWTRRALEERRQRYAKLPVEARGLERALERTEGLSHYASAAAGARVLALDLPEAGFGPADHRERCRVTGAALAALLDRFSEPWRARLLADEASALDTLLRSALASPEVDPPDFEPMLRADVEDQAVLDVMRYRIEKARERKEFSQQPGWSIEVHASDEAPLFATEVATGRIRRIDATTLIHGKGLVAGNLLGRISLPNRGCLSFASGEHPLFQGVVRVLVPGIDEEPEVVETDRGVRVTAPGVELEFRSAKVRREDDRVHIDLGSM